MMDAKRFRRVKFLCSWAFFALLLVSTWAFDHYPAYQIPFGIAAGASALMVVLINADGSPNIRA